MYYRILRVPPGYDPETPYMVVCYESLNFDSKTIIVKRADGNRFVSSIQEARSLIPLGARKLEWQPVDQFLELWEA